MALLKGFLKRSYQRGCLHGVGRIKDDEATWASKSREQLLSHLTRLKGQGGKVGALESLLLIPPRFVVKRNTAMARTSKSPFISSKCFSSRESSPPLENKGIRVTE